MAIKRHLLHQRTSSFEYVQITKSEVPANKTVTSVATRPTEPTVDSPKYIQVTSNNWYYVLKGKRPNTDTLSYGELAISFGKDNESITIKNSSNELVEFKTSVIERNCVKEYRLSNPALTPVNNNECTWRIPYGDIMNANIYPETAVVFMRNKQGKQIIPDVTFNATNKTVDILIYSTSVIAEGAYTAIIMGTSYMS